MTTEQVRSYACLIYDQAVRAFRTEGSSDYRFVICMSVPGQTRRAHCKEQMRNDLFGIVGIGEATAQNWGRRLTVDQLEDAAASGTVPARMETGAHSRLKRREAISAHNLSSEHPGSGGLPVRAIIPHGSHCDCLLLAAALRIRPGAIPFDYCRNYLQQRWTMTCRHGEQRGVTQPAPAVERWKEQGEMTDVLAVLVKNA
jgi:hypothetical protein